MKALSFLTMVCLLGAMSPSTQAVIYVAYVAAGADSSTRFHNGEGSSSASAYVFAGDMEVGGYSIKARAGSDSPPRETRRFMGSTSASTSASQSGVTSAFAEASIGGRGLDGEGYQDYDVSSSS